jgi:hypothetical protein
MLMKLVFRLGRMDISKQKIPRHKVSWGFLIMNRNRMFIGPLNHQPFEETLLF